jgi:hypothetical protein
MTAEAKVLLAGVGVICLIAVTAILGLMAVLAKLDQLIRAVVP